jgi:hypothetical protein
MLNKIIQLTFKKSQNRKEISYKPSIKQNKFRKLSKNYKIANKFQKCKRRKTKQKKNKQTLS